jgi:TolB protein
MVSRTLRHGQRAEVWIAAAERGSAELLYSTDKQRLEAPNWTPDGGLLLNGDGLLWLL